MKTSAVISDGGRYRYSLVREWRDGTGRGGVHQRILWVMLNPSTADATRDDATLTRIIDFSRQWGYGSLEVVNLFAYRATDPGMLKALDLGITIGPKNDFHIAKATDRAARIVCAWGANKTWGRASAVEVGLRRSGKELFRLGSTQAGHPVHPLRQRKDKTLEVWSPACR